MDADIGKSGTGPWDGVLFYTALALLLGHEMDAVAEAEWRMLPLLNLLDDATARAVFIAAHVPLVALLLGLVGHRRAAVRLWSRAAVDAFLVIHAGLHWALSADPLYTFHAPLSEALIFGGALLGLAHLAVLARRVPLARKGV